MVLFLVTLPLKSFNCIGCVNQPSDSFQMFKICRKGSSVIILRFIYFRKFGIPLILKQLKFVKCCFFRRCRIYFFQRIYFISLIAVFCGMSFTSLKVYTNFGIISFSILEKRKYEYSVTPPA